MIINEYFKNTPGVIILFSYFRSIKFQNVSKNNWYYTPTNTVMLKKKINWINDIINSVPMRNINFHTEIIMINKYILIIQCNINKADFIKSNLTMTFVEYTPWIYNSYINCYICYGWLHNIIYPTRSKHQLESLTS